MSNEDYRQGYRDGFKDGQEAEKNRVNPYDISKWKQAPLSDVKETCPKCGMKLTSPMGYVCASPNCPTFLQVTCDVGNTWGAKSVTNIKVDKTPGYNYQKEEGGLDRGLGDLRWTR